MALVVNTNVNSLIAHRSLSFNGMRVSKSMEKLASGFRINHAADDAAGLTISENLMGQIRGTKQALKNANDGISILQIAEGSLSVIGENLQRIRELVIQAANDTNSTTQRNAIEEEIRARLNDNDRIANAAQFNGINLLDGTATNALLQIGANSAVATNTVDITTALADARSGLTGLAVVGAGQTFATVAAIDLNAIVAPATTAGGTNRLFLDDIDAAITTLTSRRSTIGSLQNQLESVINNLTLAVENFSASNSRIKDLDVAAETATYTQYQILQQASVSILSQANQTPNLALQLLQK
jgi:flagellin